MGLLDYSFTQTWRNFIRLKTIQRALSFCGSDDAINMNTLWMRKLYRNCYLAFFSMYNNYRHGTENIIQFFEQVGILEHLTDENFTLIQEEFEVEIILREVFNYIDPDDIPDLISAFAMENFRLTKIINQAGDHIDKLTVKSSSPKSKHNPLPKLPH